jgi:2-dehydro-3-deoxygluconokinase
MLCLARLLQGVDPQLTIITALGSSGYSAWLRKRIEREGVRVIEPQVLGEPGIYGIPPDRDEQSPFSYWRRYSAAHHFLQTARFAEFDRLIPRPDLLVVTGITLALCSPQSFEDLVRWVDIHGGGCRIVFDLNYRPALWPSNADARRRIGEFEGLASVLATGVEDERTLWQSSGPEAIMGRLANSSAECIVRAGREGCWVGSGSRWDHVPTTPVTVVDSAGAGDAHLAGFIAAKINGCSGLGAAAFANSVASRIVSQCGSAPGPAVAFPEVPRA